MQRKGKVRASGESDALAGLSEEQRRLVETAVVDNVLEGWDPATADLKLPADYAAGKITAEHYRAASDRRRHRLTMVVPAHTSRLLQLPTPQPHRPRGQAGNLVAPQDVTATNSDTMTRGASK